MSFRAAFQPTSDGAPKIHLHSFDSEHPQKERCLETMEHKFLSCNDKVVTYDLPLISNSYNVDELFGKPIDFTAYCEASRQPELT